MSLGYQHWWLLPSLYSAGTGKGVGSTAGDPQLCSLSLTPAGHSLDSKGPKLRSDGILPTNFTSKTYKSMHSFPPARTLDRPLSTNVDAVITQQPSCSIKSPVGVGPGTERVMPITNKYPPNAMQPRVNPHTRPRPELPPLPIWFCSWVLEKNRGGQCCNAGIMPRAAADRSIELI